MAYVPRIIECWCCGKRTPVKARDLCQACYARWRYHGFTGPGPGPSRRPPQAESARDYLTVITSLSAAQAARRIGVTPRTITRWRGALRQAS